MVRHQQLTSSTQTANSRNKSRADHVEIRYSFLMFPWCGSTMINYDYDQVIWNLYAGTWLVNYGETQDWTEQFPCWSSLVRSQGFLEAHSDSGILRWLWFRSLFVWCTDMDRYFMIFPRLYTTFHDYLYVSLSASYKTPPGLEPVSSRHSVWAGFARPARLRISNTRGEAHRCA